MPVTELLLEGLRLMVIGMGIVFSFLLLLVAVLRLMSGVVARFAPESPVPLDAAGPARADGARDGDLVAVISAAIARYRAGRQGQ